jgi:hypothetical protein
VRYVIYIYICIYIYVVSRLRVKRLILTFKGNLQTPSPGQHSTLTKEVTYSSVTSAHICQTPLTVHIPHGSHIVDGINKL